MKNMRGWYTRTMKKKKSLIGYLDKEDIKNWGNKLCNAFCMPAVCIEPYSNARIKVKITIEEIGE